MTVIVNQPFGIGDVIWCQTIVRRVANGNPILWPVFPQFVDGLNRAYPDITFIDWRTLKINYDRQDQYTITLPEYGDCTVLPLRHADTIMKVPYTDCMKSKYMLYGMDWQDWRESAKWLKDGLPELQLSKMMRMGSCAGDKFSIINTTFGSDSQLIAKIPVNALLSPSIFMSSIPGYSLFDWAMLLQEANEIHTVSTSIIYLLEMLELKAKEIHLYSRKRIENGVLIDGNSLDNVSYILQKHKYILHP